jgi:hypothetical protein
MRASALWSSGLTPETRTGAYFLNEMTCWIPVGRFEYGDVTSGSGE